MLPDSEMKTEEMSPSFFATRLPRLNVGVGDQAPFAPFVHVSMAMILKDNVGVERKNFAGLHRPLYSKAGIAPCLQISGTNVGYGFYRGLIVVNFPECDSERLRELPDLARR